MGLSHNRNRLTRAGIGLLSFFILVSVFADFLSPHDPWERFEPFLPPGQTHLLGTNDMGNDILSELIYGSRVSLFFGLGTAMIATLIGLSVGVLSGYFRGMVDEMLMGATDVFLLIPEIPLVILVAAVVKPSYPLMAVVLGLVWWTGTARVIRSQALQVREMPFVAGDRTLGFSHTHIILSDVLPNVHHVLVPKFMLTVASAMIAEASLSFLGLGDPSRKSWGTIMRYAFERGGFINEMWWWYFSPGVSISLCVLSIVLIGSATERDHRAFSSEV